MGTATKYTNSEIKKMRAMNDQGKSVKQIANALNRSISAVRSKMYREGMIRVTPKKEHVEENELYRIEPRESREPYTGPSTAEINQRAKQAGLSYGRYVGLKAMGGIDGI